MEGPSILLNDPKGAAPRKPAPDFMQGWSLLLWMGWLFLIVGLANLVLIWVPLRLGVPEYEFGAAANSLDSLPLPVMGLVFVLAASRAQGRAVSAGFARVVAILLAALIVSAGVLYWLNVPAALTAVKEPLIRLGIKKSIIKVTIQAVLYPAALLTFATLGRRK